jgi:hypothetical protein
MISAENRSEDCSVRNLLGLPGSHDWARTTEDSALCGGESGGDASDRNGGSVSVDEQITSDLGSSLATGLPAEESRNNGRPNSSRQLGQVRWFRPATVDVRGSPATKHSDQALWNIAQSTGLRRRSKLFFCDHLGSLPSLRNRLGDKRNTSTPNEHRFCIISREKTLIFANFVLLSLNFAFSRGFPSGDRGFTTSFSPVRPFADTQIRSPSVVAAMPRCSLLFKNLFAFFCDF